MFEDLYTIQRVQAKKGDIIERDVGDIIEALGFPDESMGGGFYMVPSTKEYVFYFQTTEFLC